MCGMLPTITDSISRETTNNRDEGVSGHLSYLKPYRLRKMAPAPVFDLLGDMFGGKPSPTPAFEALDSVQPSKGGIAPAMSQHHALLFVVSYSSMPRILSEVD